MNNPIVTGNIPYFTERNYIMFCRNQGALERFVRLFLGVGLLVWGYWISGDYWISYQSPIYPIPCWEWDSFISHGCMVERGFAIAVIGLIPFSTGLFGWCPLKSILGLKA